jgi:hypothetical protein
MRKITWLVCCAVLPAVMSVLYADECANCTEITFPQLVYKLNAEIALNQSNPCKCDHMPLNNPQPSDVPQPSNVPQIFPLASNFSAATIQHEAQYTGDSIQSLLGIFIRVLYATCTDAKSCEEETEGIKASLGRARGLLYTVEQFRNTVCFTAPTHNEQMCEAIKQSDALVCSIQWLRDFIKDKKFIPDEPTSEPHDNTESETLQYKWFPGEQEPDHNITKRNNKETISRFARIAGLNLGLIDAQLD